MALPVQFTAKEIEKYMILYMVLLVENWKSARFAAEKFE